MDRGSDAQKYVWEGAIPLQIHLHESEVTTLPPPPPALILAPRIGYLPLLVPQIKPFFSSALPPGTDTVWFEYKGLPLKWYIPTGVLFDLLCPEPERPWNLTVHFRGYPGNILTPCEGEDSVKWSFINSLKEAAYIINGNCKNVMNMSQSDQVELWRSVMNGGSQQFKVVGDNAISGNLETYIRVSSKLKLGVGGDEFSVKLNSPSSKTQRSIVETDTSGSVKTGRIPVRLYVCNVHDDFEDLEDAPHVDSWDKIAYINRPIEIHREEFFAEKNSISEEMPQAEVEDEQKSSSGDGSGLGTVEEVRETLREHVELCSLPDNAEIKLLRIQGIQPKLETPFAWLANNLMNPERFLHICAYVRVPEPITI
ncbi:autophagy protein 5 isoform X14 [Diospyros lotus]|uniref:autophagy protein 5 isoform X12 n=1 Tax=Diospyros lotus TaxID=55363 RepID=UPI002257109D|nr:autophagy protein 5 isoform X12 [Diospyros lotus]XP_052190371.1 autophagy protein 5 isoform X13 [Diospyros lotus]XP_052190372.1 autophagy protein 5 isoform X14 [Diospyros lotus]